MVVSASGLIGRWAPRRWKLFIKACQSAGVFAIKHLRHSWPSVAGGRRGCFSGGQRLSGADQLEWTSIDKHLTRDLADTLSPSKTGRTCRFCMVGLEIEGVLQHPLPGYYIRAMCVRPSIPLLYVCLAMIDERRALQWIHQHSHMILCTTKPQAEKTKERLAAGCSSTHTFWRCSDCDLGL